MLSPYLAAIVQTRAADADRYRHRASHKTPPSPPASGSQEAADHRAHLVPEPPHRGRLYPAETRERWDCAYRTRTYSGWIRQGQTAVWMPSLPAPCRGFPRNLRRQTMLRWAARWTSDDFSARRQSRTRLSG